MPIITMVLAFFVLGEPMGAWQAVGAAVSFAGMIVIIVHGQLSQLLGLNFNIGELWVLLGAFGFGLYTVLLRRAKFTWTPAPAGHAAARRIGRRDALRGSLKS